MVIVLCVFRIQEDSVVSKLLAQHPLKAHRQNKNLTKHQLQKWIIYLLECHFCKVQFVGKGDGLFKIQLYNHGKDVKDASAIKADKYFFLPGHNFNIAAKIIFFEQLE